MNKKAQSVSVGLGIVAAIMIFIVGSMVIDFFKDDITLARNSTGLDCTNPAISDGSKLTCLGIDLIVPYFFLLILSVVGGLVIGNLGK